MTTQNTRQRWYSVSVVTLAMAVLGAACGEVERPFAPIPPSVLPSPPVALPSPPPAGPPAAVLGVGTFTARSFPISGSSYFRYDITLILVETAGVSGASISTPVIEMANGDRDLG